MGRTALIAVSVALLVSAPAQARTITMDASVRDSPLEIGSAHFVVHYVTAEGDRNRTTQATAQQMSDLAEQAYARFTGEWKFPGPLPDPPSQDDDPRTDIYIGYAAGKDSYAGSASPDNTKGGPTSGWLQIRPDKVGPFIAGHELFHLFQEAVTYPNEGLISEGSAQWAGNTLAALATTPGYANSDIATASQTLEATRANGVDGKDHWAFWEQVTSRFGPGIVKEVLDRSEALRQQGLLSAARQLPALDDVLRSHGSSLGQSFAEYAAAAAVRQWSNVRLRAFAPTPTATLGGGRDSRTLSVEHLAARFVSYEGSGKLGVRVGWSAGTPGAAPVLVVDGTARPLAVSGAGAAIETAVDGDALLVLANPELAGGPVPFAVESTLQATGYRSPSLRVVSKPRVRKGRLRFSVRASGRGRVIVKVKRSGRTVLTARHFYSRAGTHAFSLVLSRRARSGKRKLWLYPRGSTSDDRGVPTVLKLR